MAPAYLLMIHLIQVRGSLLVGPSGPELPHDSHYKQWQSQTQRKDPFAAVEEEEVISSSIISSSIMTGSSQALQQSEFSAPTTCNISSIPHEPADSDLAKLGMGDRKQ